MGLIETASEGYQRLKEERAADLVVSVRDSVVPLFGLSEQGLPDFEGSAVLLRVESRHFLVSAAHVFRNLRSGIYLLTPGREIEPLMHAARVSRWRPLSAPSSDAIDLGFVELADEEAATLGYDSFLPPKQILTRPVDHRALSYLVLGFPERKQERSEAELAYYTQHVYYTGRELHQAKYDQSRVKRTEHLLLPFDRRKIVSSDGKRGGEPQFRGMSGGAMWMFRPLSRRPTIEDSYLVAIFLGKAPRNGKALIGARMSLLHRLIGGELPELSVDWL